MADVNDPTHLGPFKKLKDMGDGTHAEVVYAQGAASATQGAATSGQSGDLVQGAATTSTPTYVTATTNPLSLDTHGGLRTTLQDAAGTAVSVGADRMISVLGTTLTRPANTTAYSANDSISDNATAGSVTALPVTVSDLNDAPVALAEIELDTNDTGLAAGVQVDIFVYNSDPTANSGVGGGDNAAFSNKKTGFRARFRGTFTAFSDGGKATCRPVDGDNNCLPIAVIYPATGAKTIWVQYKVISSAGFTPSANSTTITPRVKGFQGRA